MKFLITIAAIAVLTFSANGQNCTCESNFEWLKKTFEENDAGFRYILDKKGQAAYDAHNQLILGRVRNAENLSECVLIMNEWTEFFRRGHIFIEQLIGEQIFSRRGEKPEKQDTSLWDDAFRKFLNTNVPYLDRLNETTLYLRIPSFDHNFKEIIDQVIIDNRDKILSTKNLIIDLRNNGGGSDPSYSELLPLLYTNPIRQTGVEFLSTPHNNQRFLDFATNPEYREFFDDETLQQFKEYYDTLQGRLGEFVNLVGDIKTVQFDTVYAYPKNIGIIINGGCGSTTEQFLLDAKQSKKVKLFGTTTFGALDISNMHSAESPCGEFQLWYGLSRSLRIPDMVIDDIGLQPDFYLDKTIPQHKWVEFVNDVLNQ